jgi:hypothetical protein
MSTASLQRAADLGATRSVQAPNHLHSFSARTDFRVTLVSATLSRAMTSSRTTRLTRMRLYFAAVATLAISASLVAQTPRPTQTTPPASTLPAAPPTTPAAIPTVPLRPSQIPPNRAQVTYTNGMLSVSADNSSLNQILRLIAADTGMKITGGVADDRVFGNYGPADPARVLTELLEGTGSNMVLVQHDDASLAELILTTRTGGPTPPNPNAASYNDRPEPPRPAFDRSQQNSPDSPATAPTAPAVDPAATSTTTPSSTTTQPDSPNGVKTPQQIYEQLQRLRQQPQQPQTQQPSQPQTQPE